MYSILHISDLHRSSDDPITNVELLSSMRADMHRYLEEDPRIRKPDAIIISGDIIQGVGLGTPNHNVELASQYEIASDFIGQLCEEYLDGDRSRVVIVPGNHDVDWNTAHQAMEEVPARKSPKFDDAFREDSIYRWSWKERKYFRVVAPDIYAERLNAYWNFVDEFYDGVSIPHFVKGSDFNIFQLCNGRIGVAAFNSCHGNDCFAYHGAVRRGAISECHLELSKFGFELWMAVWHHNFEGPPYRNDYMDIDLVRNMIGRGFRLGLHGHQHRNQAEPRRVFLPESETMVVVSAGSLCAGKKELPTGLYRQYNLLELQDDFKQVRIHVRHMATAQLFSPAHLDVLGGRSFIDFPLEQSKEVVDGIKKRLAKSVLEAERLLKDGEQAAAIEMLGPVFGSLEIYGRAIFFEACAESGRWDLIMGNMGEPQTVRELVFLVTACERERQVERGRAALREHGDRLNIDPGTRQELEGRLMVSEIQST